MKYLLYGATASVLCSLMGIVLNVYFGSDVALGALFLVAIVFLVIYHLLG